MAILSVCGSHALLSCRMTAASLIFLLFVFATVGQLDGKSYNPRSHRKGTLNIRGSVRAPTILSSHSPQCGWGWQDWYAATHKQTLQLHDPSLQRFAVADLANNGLGDRLTSAVTVFYFALVTGRAFRIKWKDSTPGNSLASVLEAPNIDWDSTPGDMEEASTHREDWYLQFGMHPPDARDFIVFGTTDLRRLAPESRTVAFKLNAGSIDKLFYNPYHRQQLFEWGLRPETAVGCALDFLFKPRQEVLDLVRANYEALRDTQALKIGIHVRRGDEWLQLKPYGICDGDIDFEDLSRWFRCATQIEDEYRIENQTVLWYVVSDCSGLRKKAAEAYGGKVLLPSRELVTEHITFQSGNFTKDRVAFQTAFAEQWLLGMTDFQVITEASSFGRLAALRSLRFRSVYTIRDPKVQPEPLQCKRAAFDDFEDVAVNQRWVKVL